MFHKQKDQFEQSFSSGLYLDLNIFHLWNFTFTLQSVIFELRFKRSESIRQTLFLRQYIEWFIITYKILEFSEHLHEIILWRTNTSNFYIIE